ncbi:MAG: lysophospholipase [Acidobacteria bacterium RIFCSPLOWO2_12_FULL_67_14b]|nr:MAG: lysophospholipase [Acidobacteria bacterium RIFCSPLOWO2_12_FULL_67_14b]
MTRRIALALVAVASWAFTTPTMLAQSAPTAQPAAAEAPKPNDYRDDKSWLCRPGRKGDACDIDLTATVVAADGTLTRETFTADPKAPIDCFYAYPTISTDPTDNSDMTADPAELNVVAQQFARFASKCRTYAPLYRQLTLTGLRKRLAGANMPFERGVQFDDVRDAWRSYLQHDNQGRGVVIIGHSQGSYVLMELIRQEVEGKPVQKQLVSALILGATLEVPKGRDVGGAFKQIPLCRKPGQIGCVVNFSAFRSTVTPPPNTLFGKAQDPATNSGSCTNPVTLGDGPAPLRAYLSNSGRTITGTAAIKPWAADKTVDTPWVSVPGLLTARCAANENATYLEITVNGNPADPRVDDITGDLGAVGKALANWGLHLVDVNLAMGNLLDLVAQQSKAYAARR